MVGGLIPFEELPEWVPGKVLLASDGQNWKRVALRSYHYQGQDVVVPAMREFMLVSYRTTDSGDPQLGENDILRRMQTVAARNICVTPT